jgi:hypothetical protein
MEEKARSQSNREARIGRVKDPLLAHRQAIARRISNLSGSEILNRILEYENPQKIIQEMAAEDFFWLVKKVGVDDCLPVLEMATVDQWTYLLDLEIWQKDRMDVENTSLWLRRLQQAQPGGLSRWLFGQGQSLIYYYLYRNIELIIKDKEEDLDLSAGFFSLDGVFYIRVIDPRYRDTIEDLLREMAHEDSLRYQALLLGLAGLLPAEIEEEMYRMRNVRLAEHGFLPYEEAISIYTPLDIEALKTEKAEASSGISIDQETSALVPLSPLYHAGTENILAMAVSQITEPVFLDRLRLEFAGLCNQLLSAEGLFAQDIEGLIKTCRRAAGYLNLAVERLCGTDVSSALKLLERYSLVSVFRVGFGLTIKVKWEAERWIKTSWFRAQGLGVGFWGEPWGQILSGILQRRPNFFVGLHQDGEEFREVQWLSDLGDCLKVLRRLMVLDAILERISQQFQVEADLSQSNELTFHSLLFNFWARSLLGLEPSFSGIPISHARAFFRHVRSGRKRPPYRMDGFYHAFVEFFMSHASRSDTEAVSILKEALSLIWQEFQEEYQWVAIRDLSGRYSRFISITPSS